MNKTKNEKLFRIVCAVEAIIIGILSCALVAHTDVLRRGSAEIRSVGFTDEKQYFADANWQYRERERMYMQGQFRDVDICFLGDSITQRLEWQEFFSGCTVANRGIGSDTTLGALSRLDSVIAVQPEVVSILLGINDLSIKRSPDEILQTYSMIIEKLKSELPKTRIVISSVLPVKEKEGIAADTICAVNDKLNKMCSEYGITYVDAFSVLANEERWLKDEYAVDTVHLSVDGYIAYLMCLEQAIFN